MLDMLSTVQAMQAVQVPVYDFTLHQRAQETRRVEPADVVIIEGILVLHSEPVRKLLNMKIYVDTDDDVRLARRCVVQTQISGVSQLHRKLYALAFCKVLSAYLPVRL
jgi:uridine kinase